MPCRTTVSSPENYSYKYTLLDIEVAYESIAKTRSNDWYKKWSYSSTDMSSSSAGRSSRYSSEICGYFESVLYTLFNSSEILCSAFLKIYAIYTNYCNFGFMDMNVSQDFKSYSRTTKGKCICMSILLRKDMLTSLFSNGLFWLSLHT